MTPQPRLTLPTLLASASLWLSTSLFAQPMMGPGHPMEPGGSGWRHHESIQGAHEQHLASLKAQLKLTDAQQDAWRQFTQSHQPPARQARSTDTAEWARLKTPERLDKMQALMEEHYAARKAQWLQHAEATRTFYAQLTPEQQQVFDTQTWHRHAAAQQPQAPTAPRRRPIE